MVLVKKYEVFLFQDLVEIRLKIMLNNFVDKEKTFEDN